MAGMREWMKRLKGLAAICAGLTVTGCGGLGLSGSDAPAPARTGEVLGFAVGSEPYSVRAGREALEAGGSAADAAVAMALTLAVTDPSSASLGGGGLCLVYNGRRKSASSIDFLPRAPSTAGAIAVPGMLKGLGVVHQEWGRLGWHQLVEPARRLAADGHYVTAPLAEAITRHRNKIAVSPRLQVLTSRREPGIAAGTPLRVGDVLIQTQLGGVLERVRDDGPQAFYRKLIADRLLKDMRVAGGTVTGGDLAEHRTYVSRAQAIGGVRQNVYLPAERVGAGAFLADLWAAAGRLDARATASPDSLAGAVHDLNAELLDQYGVAAAGETAYGSSGFVTADREGNAVACGLTMGAPFGTGGMGPLDGVVYAEAPTAGRSGLAGAFLSPVLAVDEGDGALRFAGISAGNGHAPAVVTAAGLAALKGGIAANDILTADGSGQDNPGHAIFCPGGRARGVFQCAALADPQGQGMAETAVKR